MAESAPKFALFVSSVEGRLVSRWDAPSSSFGARVATAEERKAGSEPIVWDPACVVPLTEQFAAKCDRELRNAFKNGDLKKRTEADWRAWLELDEKRETERVAALEKAEAEAKVAAQAAEQPAEADPANKPAEGSKKRKP